MAAKHEPVKLRRTVESLDAIDQPVLKVFYQPGEDGKFYLGLDGDDPKLEEFRTNNRSLNNRVADLEAKLKTYDGIDDPAAARDALEKVKTLATAGDDATKKAADLEQQLQTEREAHRATKRQALVTAAFMAHGGEPKAADYVTSLAATTFTVNGDGKLTTTARDAEGHPLTVERWLNVQQRERPFLFKPSKGGGAATNGHGGPPPKPSISRDDPLAFGQHVEAIAAGKMVVR